ncbi:hypothetical protein CsSME_00006566 [Camellia sinensis var. sinensis]
MSENGRRRVWTMWKVPTKLVEPKLDTVTEGRVKQMRELKDNEGRKWDDLVKPSALFAFGLGPEPAQGDP